MAELLPFLVLGLTSGSVYGMAGVGLVLTYKTSGVFNFGFGAIGTLAAYVFYWLNVQNGVPWPVAALVAVVLLGIVLGLLFDVFAKRLARTALAIRVVATLGIVLIVQGAFTILYGTQARTFPTFLPSESYAVLGAFVSQSQVIVMVIGLVSTFGLYLFFRKARLGIAMRAVVDDPDLLDLAGTKPQTVRRIAWIVGSMFALASGILLAQSVNLDPVVLTALIAQAYAAAAIGAFASLPMTYLGGLVVGVASALLTKYIPTVDIIAGIPASLPFILLFVVLVVMPKRRLATRLQSIPLPSSAWSAPLRVHALWGVVALVVLGLVPLFVGAQIGQWTNVLTMAIMFLALGLLVKTSGQVSLCHAGFGAIGAAAFATLVDGVGLPWFLGLIGAGLVAVPIGALIAIPAIRLSGLYLALATFGFGLLLQNMFYNTDLMFGSNGFGLTMPRPDADWANTDSGFYYLVLAITVMVAILAVTIIRTRLGRLLRALGDSPVALSTGGAGVHTTQVLVFCISAFFAAISGALLGVSLTVVDGTSFDPTLSLTMLALILLSVGGPPWYALMQGALFILIPVYVEGRDTEHWLMVLFGVFAILTAFTGGHNRVPAWVVSFSDTLARLLGHRPPTPAAVGAPAILTPTVPAPGSTGAADDRAAGPPRAGVQVRDLRVQFGGLVAVDGLSLAAPVGRITGLIGPNGAGKTTTFDAICGLNSPATGEITIHGNPVGHAPAAARAQLGLGRTFQQMQLYDSLSVRQNVRLGREAALAGRSPFTQLMSGRAKLREIDRSAEEAMVACGIADLADRRAGDLSTGQRRLVELTRCLAGPFDVLLLDEPSSGLDGVETAEFGDLLLKLVRERDVGILLVEHDMSLVMRVCAAITVIDFGRVVFEGTPAEVASSPVVQAAYLGSEARGSADLERRIEAEVSRS